MNSLINIKNNRDILQYIVSEFKRLNWAITGSVTLNLSGKIGYWNDYRNKTASYFEIDYQLKTFSWIYADGSGSGEEDEILSLKDAKFLMSFVEQTQDLLREEKSSCWNKEINKMLNDFILTGSSKDLPIEESKIEVIDKHDPYKKKVYYEKIN